MINLTIPLYPNFPGGSVFPWESPFQTEDIATYDRNGARLFYIALASETGTRLMGPSLVKSTGASVAEASLPDLLNRDTSVLRISKGPGEAITCSDLDAALKNVSPLQAGDALLIATGWGDEKRWKKIGSDYATRSPYFTQQAAHRLLEIMQDAESNLLLTDCVYLDQPANSLHHRPWLEAPAWMRPPFPSDQARSYLRCYTTEMVQMDWPITIQMLSHVWAVVGLANCGSFTADRLRVSCLPMFIDEAGEAPCTIVAEEL